MHYPEVDIIEEIWIEVRTTQPAFRWHYYITGSELELYDNADLNRVPKAIKNIKICFSYLDYGLRLPFSHFIVMVLNHFH